MPKMSRTKNEPLNWYHSMKIFLEPKTSKTVFSAIFVISAILVSLRKTFIKFQLTLRKIYTCQEDRFNQLCCQFPDKCEVEYVSSYVTRTCLTPKGIVS